jgi:hypothetical protein
MGLGRGNLLHARAETCLEGVDFGLERLVWGVGLRVEG